MYSIKGINCVLSLPQIMYNESASTWTSADSVALTSAGIRDIYEKLAFILWVG